MREIRLESNFFELPSTSIHEKQIGYRIIRDKEIHQPIVVYVCSDNS